jgi:hypothetical protein
MPIKVKHRPRITTQIKRSKNKVMTIIREDGRIRFIQTVEQKIINKGIDCDRLQDGIFQGAQPSQRPFFVDAVVNLETEFDIDYRTEMLQGYLWAPIDDKPAARPTIQWLDQVVNTLIAWRKLGWQILIHCKAGRSRSSLISVAYFMKTQHCNVDAALALVRHYRKQANPNIGFLGALVEYEAHLQITNS